MKNLEQGVHRFQQEVFKEYASAFKQLANGQCPETLFITCSDSSIDPSLITQTQPGELLVLRNIGNVVPKYTVGDLSSAATIEFAVNTVGVKRVIVCGHSGCSAMKGLKNTHALERTLPLVKTYFQENFETYFYEHVSLESLIKNNVKYQLESLMTFPFIKEKVETHALALNGWVFSAENGQIMDVVAGKVVGS